MLEFGAALPRIRKTVSRHVTRTGLGRERVLAASIRLIDLGFFRPGGGVRRGERYLRPGYDPPPC
jgi:DNA topoisomerase IB